MAFSLSGGVSGAASGAQLGSSFGPYGAIIGGVAGGALGAFTGKKKKQDPYEAALQGYKPYSGLRPPRVNYDPNVESPVPSPGNILRPVQQMITDTVSRRSQGQDVGYDPARRNKLQENFDIQQNRDYENQSADIKNRLAGQGLSRNAAANDDALGRALRAKNEEKAIYTNKIDIEDLARANEERDVNTGRLQALNAQNFGQENTAANFDLNAYNSENQSRLGFGGLQLRAEQQAYDQYEDPYASALGIAGNAISTIRNNGSSGSPVIAGESATPDYQKSIYGQNGSYVQPLNSASLSKDPYAMALRSGKNFGV